MFCMGLKGEETTFSHGSGCMHGPLAGASTAKLEQPHSCLWLQTGCLTHYRTMQSVARSVSLRLGWTTRLYPQISCQRAFSATKLCSAKGDPAIQPSSKASPEDAPAAKAGDSAMIRQEDASEGEPRHALDYNVAVDYRTSYGSG